MKSAVPKVLHPIAGLPMLGHAMRAAAEAGANRMAVVVGPGMEDVARAARGQHEGAAIYVQHQQLGTANATLAAREAIQGHQGDVMVLYGDTPLITGATLGRLRAALDGGAAVAVLGFEAADPTGYGRLLREGDRLVAIREEKEATEAERQVRLCNSGVMAFRVPDLLAILDGISNANAKGEFYLTDAVEVARAGGLTAGVVTCPESEVLGVNSRDQLAAAEALWQQARRLAVMREGASLIAPETVWFSYDTEVGQDVVIEPNVFFGPGVVIEDRVTIKANTHLQGHDGKSRAGVRVRSGAEIGPFARLRPGADIGREAHIGNFVEVKAANLGDGAKANHLAYIGDATVGSGANIGAGTIFCNYDGFFKHHTEVGEGAFVGSNSSLVAPVRIGAGAFVASGSVVNKDVSPDALAITRAEQSERPGWAAKFRQMMQRRKAQRAAE